LERKPVSSPLLLYDPGDPVGTGGFATRIQQFPNCTRDEAKRNM